MNNKELVSIIIPVYNREEMIKDSINSVLSQSYENLEVIVIDDGSTDNTIKEIKKLNDQRIVLLKSEHKGPYHARNIGIKHSKGKYIAFLDSDDMWFSDKLEKQIKKFEEYNDVSLVFTDRIVFHEKNKNYFLEKDIKKNKEKILSDQYKELLKKNYIATSSVVVKKKIFDEIGYFIEENRGDLDYNMWLRIARKYPIKYIPEPLVLFKVHENRMTEKRLNRIIDKKYVLDIEEEWLTKNNLEKEKKIVHIAKSNDLKEYFMHVFFTKTSRKKSFEILIGAKKEVRKLPTLIWFLLWTITPYFLDKPVKSLKKRFNHLFYNY